MKNAEKSLIADNFEDEHFTPEKEIILKCQECKRIIFDLEADPSFTCPKCGSTRLEVFKN